MFSQHKEMRGTTPITFSQKDDGGHEIVPGHKRRKAPDIAELPTIKAETKEINGDEAIILMVKSNLQRPVISPGEKSLFI